MKYRYKIEVVIDIKFELRPELGLRLRLVGRIGTRIRVKNWG